MKKLPPFGKELVERLRFKNIPGLVRITIGMNSWERAKKWRDSNSDFCALVYDGRNPVNSYTWPVAACFCIIEWNVGPSEEQVISLCECLLKSGAESVIVNPLFVDFNKPAFGYDTSKPFGDRWIQQRESIHVYRQPKMGVLNVA